MKLSKFTKLATVSAFALMLAYPIGSANATSTQNGGNIGVTIGATVTNSFDAVVTTNIDYDDIDVRGDSADTATAVLSPVDASFTPDPGTGGGSAAITNNSGTQVRAVITATLLPNDTDVSVSYNTVVDLTDGTSSFNVALLDDLDAPDIGTAGTAGSYPVGGPATPGTATTDGTGQLTFGIGGSITTVAGDNYDPGTYAGSFNVTISY